VKCEPLSQGERNIETAKLKTYLSHKQGCLYFEDVIFLVIDRNSVRFRFRFRPKFGPEVKFRFRFRQDFEFRFRPEFRFKCEPKVEPSFFIFWAYFKVISLILKILFYCLSKKVWDSYKWRLATHKIWSINNNVVHDVSREKWYFHFRFWFRFRFRFKSVFGSGFGSKLCFLVSVRFRFRSITIVYHTY